MVLVRSLSIPGTLTATQVPRDYSGLQSVARPCSVSASASLQDLFVTYVLAAPSSAVCFTFTPFRHDLLNLDASANLRLLIDRK